jgi:hypothetical protein
MIVAEMHYRNLAVFLAICVGLVLLAIAFIPFYYFLNRKLTGWMGLTDRFPLHDLHKTGETYWATGFIRRQNSGRYRLYQIEFAAEGFIVTPNFARAWPILVPWSKIRNVAAMVNRGSSMFDSDVTIYVEDERGLGFSVPIAALATIQANVPADRIQQTTLSSSSAIGGVFEMARNRSRQ